MKKPFALDNERLWIDAANVVAVLPISEDKRSAQGWDSRFTAQVVAVGSEGGLDTRPVADLVKAFRGAGIQLGYIKDTDEAIRHEAHLLAARIQRRSQRSGAIFPFRRQTRQRSGIVARRDAEASARQQAGNIAGASLIGWVRGSPRARPRGVRALVNRAPPRAGLGLAASLCRVLDYAERASFDRPFALESSRFVVRQLGIILRAFFLRSRRPEGERNGPTS